MKQKIMAITAIIMASLAINTIHAQTVVNDKIQAKFQQTFPNAERTKWVPVKNGYEARFSQNGIETIVGYNKTGRPDYLVERYGADKLPSSIRRMLNDAYQEYDVINAIEVRSGGKVNYLVNIESKKFSKVIRINGDDMDVYKDMAISSQ